MGKRKCLYVSSDMYVDLCVSVCLCMYVCICVYLSVSEYLCISVYVHVLYVVYCTCMDVYGLPVCLQVTCTLCMSVCELSGCVFGVLVVLLCFELRFPKRTTVVED